jgi:hypothetical protein
MSTPNWPIKIQRFDSNYAISIKTELINGPFFNHTFYFIKIFHVHNSVSNKDHGVCPIAKDWG